MGKVPMIFEIKLAVEEAENKIGVWEESHGQTGNRSPISNFLLINRPGNDGTGESMGNTVHNFMITWKRSLRQMGNPLVIS
jgi:hypothetical protein